MANRANISSIVADFHREISTAATALNGSLPLSHLWKANSLYLHQELSRMGISAAPAGKTKAAKIAVPRWAAATSIADVARLTGLEPRQAPERIKLPKTRTTATVLEHPEAVARPAAVQLRIIELAIAWYDQFLRSIGLEDYAAQPFPVRPDAALIDAAVGANNPVMALTFYEHYYNLSLFERFCADLVERAAGYGNKKVVIAEIGTIHGALAAMVTQKYPNVSYVLIDIPDSLCITLSGFMNGSPEKRFKLVRSQADLESADLTAYDFVFVPSIFAEGLAGKPIDLVWSFHAFGEFSNPYIAFYYDLIQRQIRPQYFIHRSRFLNAVDRHNIVQRSGENMAGLLADNQWSVRHWALEPAILSCPYIDATRHPRYLEVIFHREETSADASIRIRDKAALLETVSVQAWVEILRSPSSHTMTYGIRPMRFDLSQDGVLASLWNSLRLSPGRDNILMLMHYLDYCALGSGKPFEEWFFLAAVLRCLHELAPDYRSREVKAWIKHRAGEGADASFRPLPSFRPGFEAGKELIDESAVRHIMALVNVPALLGIVAW